jgi:ribosome-binding protein aMBF1 (putative translation factor)
MLRQGAGLVTLQRLFDQCDETQKQCGDIIIEMIQKNWSYNKVAQVIGEEPTPEFDNKAFFNYGCKVVQGVLTESQQQLELAQLMELSERFGPIFPMEEIVEAMTIQNKDRIVEKMMQNQQQQQQQEQQMAQLQMQQMQVDNETKLAYARSQDGLAQERLAKIQSDRAVNYEKIKRSEEEETAGLLNLVKAIKEIQGIDADNILKSIDQLDRISRLEVGESSLSERVDDKVGTAPSKNTISKI